MCGQLARAWGNERFATPAEEVCLAADQHEIGMLEWDRAPELDAASGLPKPVTRMDLSTHLPLRLRGPERLAAQSPYAALVASLHHTSFYAKPHPLGLVRRPGRQIRAYLRRSADFQERMRTEAGASDAEIERDWRLVRTWDALSHTLLQDRVPRTLEGVPAAAGEWVGLDVSARDGTYTVDPWPFASRRVVVNSEGWLLERAFGDPDELHRALASAPRIELSYELEPR
jgi:hypothetical protein